MSKKIVFVLADGFEEIEALTPVDVLRRLNFEVVIAGMSGMSVKGAHNVTVGADCLLSSVKPEGVDMVVLPGGMPGSLNLKNSDAVMDFVKKVYAAGGFAAAICAAPIALHRAGLTQGKNITAYPGFDEELKGAKQTGKPAERDGRIITGKGAGASFEFAARLADALGKGAEVKELYKKMFAAPPAL
jgi:DJ-1 family protein